MARYQLTTLVDITRSQAARGDTDLTKQGQQANFNSVVQGIGMRSNIEWNSDPKLHTRRIPNQTGKANHWIWEFETERDYVFQKGDDPVGLLIDDLHNVPVVAELTNTADIYPAAFQTKGDKPNTWVQIIS